MTSAKPSFIAVILSGILALSAFQSIVLADELGVQADAPARDVEAVTLGASGLFEALRSQDNQQILRGLHLTPHAERPHVFLPPIAKLAERENLRLEALQAAERILERITCAELDPEWLAYDGRYAASCFGKVAEDSKLSSELRVKALQTSFAILACAGKRPTEFLTDGDEAVVQAALEFFEAPISQAEKELLVSVIDSLNNETSIQSASIVCGSQPLLEEKTKARIRELVLSKEDGSGYDRAKASICLKGPSARDRAVRRKLRKTLPRAVRNQFPHLRRP